ncbi:Pentatricopeptide repeat-containing protein [Forsythia ovata]|uniref:Pentatricopeptide repeat-containing protein n=1 Tax=Forsythia ovata TaxID=205694 RepID=A0ABD1W3L6_9LAMI
MYLHFLVHSTFNPPRKYPLSSPFGFNIHKASSENDRNKNNHFILQSSFPSQHTFSNVSLSLRTSIENKNPVVGSCLHAKILKLGLDADVFISNSLLNMYVKCGQINDATNLFEHMPHRTVVSWTCMISGYCQNELLNESILLFSRMLDTLQPNEFTLAVLLQACSVKGDGKLIEVVHCYAIKYGLFADDYLQNSLIDAYAKSGMLGAADRLLGRLCSRHVVSWTSVISGCVYNGMLKRAFMMFFEMQEDMVLPNEVTMLSMLQAASEINNWQMFCWIHGLVLKQNWCENALVLNSLIQMYSTNGYFNEGMRIFCDLCFTGEGLYPSKETMANLLQGCTNSGFLKLGKEIHGYLIKHGFLPYTVIGNSLINMYAENKYEDCALQLFVRMANKDIVTWNTIIRCFVKNEQPIEALKLLGEIHKDPLQDKVSPDFITMLASLEACSNLATLQEGQIIHGYLTKTGLLNDIFVQNALIEMYAKSGRLNLAEKIFNEMHERDLSSWNSIIAAYGINGNGTFALQIFGDLKRSETWKPNAITFVNILSACGHGGLVEEGFAIFNSMEKHYGIKPSMEHYACIVDLLGRVGRLKEAEDFIDKMPIKPCPDVWGALLGASVLFDNIAMAEKAAKMLAVLQPMSSIWRVALSNAYASIGKWHEVAKIRAELRGLKQFGKGGWSSVNVGGYEFSFMAGDTRHPDSETIYDVVIGLQNHMQDAALFDNRIALTC